MVAEIFDLIISVLLVVALILVTVLLTRMGRTVSELESTVHRLQGELGLLLHEVSGLVDDASMDVSKFETFLDSANVVGHSMSSASKLAYTTMASPMVKMKALSAGLGKLLSVFRPQNASEKGSRK